MNARLERVDDLGNRLRMFWFRPERPVRYTAGQFTELYLSHNAADSRGQKRWFTLTSSPTEELLAITTKFSPDSSSFKQTLQALTPGSTVQLAEPMGDFVLPKLMSQPLVFVAAGIGITPVRSMIKWLHDRHEQRPLQLIYAAATPDDLIFKELFAAYPSLSYMPIVTQLRSGAAREDCDGPLTASKIVELIGNTDGKQVYLSGPEILVEALTKELPLHGVPGQRIVTDYFHGYPAL